MYHRIGIVLRCPITQCVRLRLLLLAGEGIARSGSHGVPVSQLNGEWVRWKLGWLHASATSRVSEGHIQVGLSDGVVSHVDNFLCHHWISEGHKAKPPTEKHTPIKAHHRPIFQLKHTTSGYGAIIPMILLEIIVCGQHSVQTPDQSLLYVCSEI